LIEKMKTVVQCDFDGTVTEEDVSFMLLDACARGNWRQILKQYQDGKITVGRFNTEAFAMVKASKERLLEIAKSKVKIRPGFHKFVEACRVKGFRLVIVSNGLDCYIEEILKDIGIKGVEVFAAQTEFKPDGLEVQYTGPDGVHLDAGFKDAYVDFFLKKGYRIIYIGNGTSDILPAKQSHYIFATGDLLSKCKKTKVNCIPFTDFNEIVRALESM